MYRKYPTLVAIAAAGIALGAIGTLHADEPPQVKRNIVMKEDTNVAGREGVMAYVDFPPGAAEPLHTHPADAYFFVLEGTLSQEIEGKPTVTLKAGDVVHVPQGKIHRATNTGSTPAKIAVVFFAEKDKPLTTPVK